MDKIQVNRLDNYFSSITQTLVHQSPRFSEFEMTFQEAALAQGSIKTFETHGMKLSELKVASRDCLQLIDDLPAPALESAFIVQGSIDSAFNNLPNPVCFGKQTHNLQFNPDFSARHHINKNFHAFTISYDAGYFQSLIQNESASAVKRLNCSLEKQSTFLANTVSSQWNSGIADSISAIRNCPFSGTTRYIFLEGKMMELLSLQLEQIKRDELLSDKTRWQAADKEKLYAVKDFIEHSYLNSFSLRELTYMFGLNEFKLKKGYKDLFQRSVFGHVHDLRMKKARSILEEKEMTISEAAFYIGYENVSSFSAAFKKRFGYNASKLTA